VVTVRWHRLALRTEEVLVLDHAMDGGVHLRMIVDDVRDPQLDAVVPLVRAEAAEPKMIVGYSGPAEELMRGEPALRAGLDSRSALGDQPHSTLEPRDQPGDRLNGTIQLGSGQHRCLVACEERGVPSARVCRAIDDHPADVDAQPRLPVRTHAGQIPRRWCRHLRLRRPDRIRSSQPLRIEPIGGVDRDQSELTGPTVDEAMSLARRADDDLASRHDELLFADSKSRLARLDEEHLGVRMSMELRPDSRLRVDKDDRERDVAVVRTDELMGVRLVREFVQVEDPGHGHLRWDPQPIDGHSGEAHIADAERGVREARRMTLDELTSTVTDSITVKRVFAEPYERDGVTVIAAATVAGGGGGGGGHDDERHQGGEGGGFGMTARPSGVYVVKDGQVSWRPAVDVNRLITTIGLIAVAYLLSRTRMARIRAKAARRQS
jgi:uncharacterized spore protein YtfJ